MANVICFQPAAAAKQERQKENALIQQVMDLVKEMNRDEIAEMVDAIENNDQGRYLAVTNPVIARKVIREINTKSI
ncbi:hypothetical protein SD70_02685 [Gordoniibacillus kamchatkensis]|uniref:Uncharacterized protein n=1 Tax=Gordoniibacillus kamchatkensis TaxID=1590651 RepID=A0ABR5AM85_9BACL|nr:hypothetical protein [Paenibacillus sp. VKM B-2647]KIL42106.1 hypothetical protein SD70_02685 [Paenibacillus sp. VKM B-2647]